MLTQPVFGFGNQASQELRCPVSFLEPFFGSQNGELFGSQNGSKGVERRRFWIHKTWRGSLCEQGVFARVTSNGMSVFARRSEGFQLRVTVGEYIGILWSVDRGAPQGTAAIETVRK